MADVEWSDLRIVLAIGRAGSLSGAARTLHVTHSTVFRKLNAIEARLSVRLFERMPQGYAATEAGEAVLRVAERMEAEVVDLERRIVGGDLRLEGTLRISAPEGIARVLLGPHLAEFARLQPAIRIDLDVTGELAELSRREADIVIRMTRRPPDAAFGRRVCDFAWSVYAARRYWQRSRARSLAEHPWILEARTQSLPEELVRKKEAAGIRVAFSSNDINAVAEAAREGLGVALLPCFIGDTDGKLVRVVDPPKSLTKELWILAHPDLRNTARVRAIMSFLGDSLQVHRAELEGTGGERGPRSARGAGRARRRRDRSDG